MIDNVSGLRSWDPGRLFYGGLALVLLAMWLPFIPGWYTFIHMWRVDLAASLFLFATLAFLAVRSGTIRMSLSLSKHELWLIVFPIIAFIAWSAASVVWAPSWKSAVHHTVVWIEYLIFYLLARYLVDHNGHFAKLTKLLIAVLVLFSIPAIIEFLALTAFGGETYFRARFAKYGEQVVTLLPLILFFVVRSSGRNFRIGLAALVFIWLMVYCTAGRMNLLLFGAGFAAVIALVFLRPDFREYRKKLAICVLAVAIAPVPLFLFSLVVANGEVPLVSRFDDSVGSAYSSNFRILMNSVSTEMIRSAPITGIGADNYGMEFNKYREQYARTHPSDPNLAYGEIGIVGHAHNEFLQIAAELGFVGASLFLWFLLGVGLIGYRTLRDVKRISPYAFASVVGIAMFMASSLVSAYSFRLMQNGIVFFFVLAVATRTLLKDTGKRRYEVSRAVSPRKMRVALATGLAACAILGAYSTVRVASVIITTRANYTEDLGEATLLYQQAMRLDDENPDVQNNLAMRLFQEQRFSEAVPLLQESIAIGRAESTDFSYLASAQSLSGDNEAAERTMAAASALYPRSAFVLTRYAVLLKLNGRSDESADQFSRAYAIDHRAANSWWMMINNGAQAASDHAFRSPDYTPVMDLQPQRSMYAVLDERHVRFPEERLIFRRR